MPYLLRVIPYQSRHFEILVEFDREKLNLSVYTLSHNQNSKKYEAEFIANFLEVKMPDFGKLR